MIPVMNVARQYELLHEKLDSAVLEVLHSGNYILGETVEDFEADFSSYCGVRYAVGVGNGTDALVIALRAVGVKKGDEVILPAMSFIATAEAVLSVGAKPVFADCTDSTYTIDPALIEPCITDRTRAIIPVHLYGQCADMDSIMHIARAHDIKVIEDAAQAAGALYKGHKAGSIGDIGCISFFPTKNLGAAGDGGMILTNNTDYYRKCRALRVHGSGLDGLYAYNCTSNDCLPEDNSLFHGNLPKYYNFVEGYNSRLDAIQAALLKTKLPHLDDWNCRRRDIASQYDAQIIHPAVTKPKVALYNTHIYYVYAIATQNRDSLRRHLEKKGVKTGVYFPVPLHEQRLFIDYGYKHGDMPCAEFISKNTLVLPMFPELTQQEIDTVIAAVNSWESD